MRLSAIGVCVLITTTFVSTHWQHCERAWAVFRRNLVVVLPIDMMPNYRKLPTTVRVDTSNTSID